MSEFVSRREETAGEQKRPRSLESVKGKYLARQEIDIFNLLSIPTRIMTDSAACLFSAEAESVSLGTDFHVKRERDERLLVLLKPDNFPFSHSCL